MRRPNVVLILADQHRWDFIGGGSNGVTHTPNLDRLAQAGTVFRSAYCTAPLCSPSRAALASGRYGMNTGCFTNLHELPPGTPTFVAQMRQAGYHTSAIGKTHMEIHAYDSNLVAEKHRAFMDSLGWEEICETSGNDMFKTGIVCAYSEFLREQGRYEEALEFYGQWRYFMDPERRGDPAHVCHEWSLPPELHGDAFVCRRAVEWLERRPPAPFFLHVGFGGPHSPIEPLPHFLDLYRDTPETAPWGGPPPSWAAPMRRGYRAMISEIDEYVGRITKSLARQGLLENTILIYAADHGEMAGDHGYEGKTTFYEASVRVPLLIAGPGIAAGQESAALVELIDLGHTIGDLCSVPAHALDQGRSLAPLLTGAASTHRDTLYAEMGCDRMIRDARYKLMWGDPARDTRSLGRLHLDKPVNIPPSPPRLFDLREDPHEERDLARSEAHHAVLHEMLEQLVARMIVNVQPQPNKSRGEYRPVRPG